MLRGIADFAMQGRWQAAIATALLSLAAMMFPPLNYLAGGVITLATLKTGPREGMKVLAATLVIFALLAGLVLGQLWLVGLVLLTGWLPVFIVTLALGYTRSLATGLLAAAGLGAIAVVLMHVMLGDAAQWWRDMIEPFMQQLGSQPGWQLDSAQTEQLVAGLSAMMTGFVAAGISLNAILGLLIGRAWQAGQDNAGAFGDEFRQLKLGRPAAIMTALLMAIALTPAQLPLLTDLLVVALVVFAFQGLAVVHAVVWLKQKSRNWLIAMYVLMVVMLLQMVMMLATLGVLDQWFNFRRHSDTE